MEGSLSSATGEFFRDDDPERFLAESLSLNVGRRPEVTGGDASPSSVAEKYSRDDDSEGFLAERLSLNVGRTPGVTQFWRRFQTVEST